MGPDFWVSRFSGSWTSEFWPRLIVFENIIEKGNIPYFTCIKCLYFCEFRIPYSTFKLREIINVEGRQLSRRGGQI